MLLKGTLIYLTGVLATSTSLNHLRTKVVLRESFGPFTDFEVVRLAVVWPVSVPYIVAVSVGSLPIVWKVVKEELKKKKE
jgi:hypothetical protein